MNRINYNTNEKKALIPIAKPFDVKKDVYSEDGAGENYRKRSEGHILYIRLYLLFFFMGACVFASGKFGFDGLSEKAMGLLIRPVDGFPNFCVKYAPLVFGSFIVYASGFTLYAPLINAIYSSSLFLFSGIAAGSVVYFFGISVESLAILALIGLADGICILLCSVTRGISGIASRGIDKLEISDGMLYSVLYTATVCAQYYVIRGIVYLAL